MLFTKGLVLLLGIVEDTCTVLAFPDVVVVEDKPAHDTNNGLCVTAKTRTTMQSGDVPLQESVAFFTLLELQPTSPEAGQ